MTVAFLIHLLVVVLLCVILWLGGSWFIRWLGGGEPWFTILKILIVLIVLGSIVMPLLGYGSIWRYG